MSPISNAFIAREHAGRQERLYPLHARVCEKCFLVQLEAFEPPQTHFGEDYAYFSSYSDSWLEHARRYVSMAIERFALGAASQVIEIASNDGYLLQYFVQAKVPALGIEPSQNVAAAARAKGVETQCEFFGRDAARRLAAAGRRADLLLGNNVLAHVPDLDDFVGGLQIALKPGGTVTMEFPHLLSLMRENQFDTIYHEHFSYFSFLTAKAVFAANGLRLYDVERLATHGGSLRIYACHSGDSSKKNSPAVDALVAEERQAGLDSIAAYRRFAEQVKETRQRLRELLLPLKAAGKTIAGYGAPAKGNTLLNYCGVGTDIVDYTVDRSPQKQGRLLPGTRIPVHAPSHIFETKPDYVLILPWNLKEEIMQQMDGISAWGGRFIVPIPVPAIV